MKTRLAVLFLVLMFLPRPAPAADAPAAPQSGSPLQRAEGVVHELYRLVCVPPGGDTDWDAVRGLFIPEAVIVLRVSKDAASTFGVEGWIDDFKAFNEKARSSERGFEEKIVRMEPMVFRDIAHVLVLYEARMLDWNRPPSRGVDSIELIRRDGRWWIAAITNDIPDEQNPVPAVLAP
jgi:hypothetical protein